MAQKVGFPMELTLGLFFGVNIGLILQLGEGNELLGWSCRLAQFSAIIPRTISITATGMTCNVETWALNLRRYPDDEF